VVARARAQNKIKWNQMKIRGKTKRAAPERSVQLESVANPNALSPFQI